MSVTLEVGDIMPKKMTDATARRRLLEAKTKLLNVMVNNAKLSQGALMDRSVKVCKDISHLIDKLK